jgi:hypothetical protein
MDERSRVTSRAAKNRATTRLRALDAERKSPATRRAHHLESEVQSRVLRAERFHACGETRNLRDAVFLWSTPFDAARISPAAPPERIDRGACCRRRRFVDLAHVRAHAADAVAVTVARRAILRVAFLAEVVLAIAVPCWKRWKGGLTAPSKSAVLIGWHGRAVNAATLRDA